MYIDAIGFVIFVYQMVFFHCIRFHCVSEYISPLLRLNLHVFCIEVHVATFNVCFLYRSYSHLLALIYVSCTYVFIIEYQKIGHFFILMSQVNVELQIIQAILGYWYVEVKITKAIFLLNPFSLFHLSNTNILMIFTVVVFSYVYMKHLLLHQNCLKIVLQN